MEVEVILAEIGEGRTGEPAAIDPVQGQGMAGNLHRGGVDPTLQHGREERLQLRGLRGRAHARNDRVGDPGLHRTDQSCAMPGCCQSGLQQVRDGRLAIGPGDAEQAQVAGRFAVDRRSHLPQDRPRVGHREDGAPAGAGADQGGAGGIGQHRDRAGADCLHRERGAVHVSAGQRGVEVTGLHLPRIERDAPDDRRPGCRPAHGRRTPAAGQHLLQPIKRELRRRGRAKRRRNSRARE